jgi:hypothetical protein
VKLLALKRGASETSANNLLPLGLLCRSSHGYEGWNGGGSSLPAIASPARHRKASAEADGRSGEAGGVGVKSPEDLTLPFIPSHQGRGI